MANKFTCVNLTSYKKFLLLQTEAIRAELQEYLWKLDTYQGTYWPTNKVCKSTRSHKYHSAPTEILCNCWGWPVMLEYLSFHPKSPTASPRAFPHPDTMLPNSLLCSSLLPGQWRAGIFQRHVFQRIDEVLIVGRQTNIPCYFCNLYTQHCSNSFFILHFTWKESREMYYFH